jgi:hypothetical protein
MKNINLSKGYDFLQIQAIEPFISSGTTFSSGVRHSGLIYNQNNKIHFQLDLNKIVDEFMRAYGGGVSVTPLQRDVLKSMLSANIQVSDLGLTYPRNLLAGEVYRLGDTVAVSIEPKRFLNSFAGISGGVTECLQFLVRCYYEGSSGIFPNLLNGFYRVGLSDKFRFFGVDTHNFDKDISLYSGYSQLRYVSNENANNLLFFGEDFYREVIIPVELLNPQIKIKKEIYRRSDGRYINVSGDILNLSELRTDWLDDSFHKAFGVALLQETFLLDNVLYMLEGGYEVNNKQDYSLRWVGQGKCQLVRVEGGGLMPNFVF